MREQVKDRVTWVLAVVLVVLVLIEALFFRYDHPVFPWHHLPGYAAVIGLASSILVVLLSKKLGSWLLQRPEDHE